MKKLIALLLALMMLFSFVACANNDDDDDDCKHKDKDGDGYCDKCDEEMEEDEDDGDDESDATFVAKILSQLAGAKSATFTVNVQGRQEYVNYNDYDYETGNKLDEPYRESYTSNINASVTVVISHNGKGGFDMSVEMVSEIRNNENGVIDTENERMTVYYIDGEAYDYDPMTNTYEKNAHFDAEDFEEILSSVLGSSVITDKALIGQIEKLVAKLTGAVDIKATKNSYEIDLAATFAKFRELMAKYDENTAISKIIDDMLALSKTKLTTDGMINHLKAITDMNVGEAVAYLDEALKTDLDISLSELCEAITSNSELVDMLADLVAEEIDPDMYDVIVSLKGKSLSEVIKTVGIDTETPVWDLISGGNEEFPSKDEFIETIRSYANMTVGEYEEESGDNVLASMQASLELIDLNALKATVKYELDKKDNFKKISLDLAVDFAMTMPTEWDGMEDSRSLNMTVSASIDNISTDAREISLPAGAKEVVDLSGEHEIYDDQGNALGILTLRRDQGAENLLYLGEGLIRITFHNYEQDDDTKTITIKGDQISLFEVNYSSYDFDRSESIVIKIDDTDMEGVISYSVINEIYEENANSGTYHIYDTIGSRIGYVNVTPDYIYVEYEGLAYVNATGYVHSAADRQFVVNDDLIESVYSYIQGQYYYDYEDYTMVVDYNPYSRRATVSYELFDRMLSKGNFTLYDDYRNYMGYVHVYDSSIYIYIDGVVEINTDGYELTDKGNYYVDGSVVGSVYSYITNSYVSTDPNMPLYVTYDPYTREADVSYELLDQLKYTGEFNMYDENGENSGVIYINGSSMEINVRDLASIQTVTYTIDKEKDEIIIHQGDITNFYNVRTNNYVTDLPITSDVITVKLDLDERTATVDYYYLDILKETGYFTIYNSLGNDVGSVFIDFNKIEVLYPDHVSVVATTFEHDMATNTIIVKGSDIDNIHDYFYGTDLVSFETAYAMTIIYNTDDGSATVDYDIIDYLVVKGDYYVYNQYGTPFARVEVQNDQNIYIYVYGVAQIYASQYTFDIETRTITVDGAYVSIHDDIKNKYIDFDKDQDITIEYDPFTDTAELSYAVLENDLLHQGGFAIYSEGGQEIGYVDFGSNYNHLGINSSFVIEFGEYSIDPETCTVTVTPDNIISVFSQANQSNFGFSTNPNDVITIKYDKIARRAEVEYYLLDDLLRFGSFYCYDNEDNIELSVGVYEIADELGVFNPYIDLTYNNRYNITARIHSINGNVIIVRGEDVTSFYEYSVGDVADFDTSCVMTLTLDYQNRTFEVSYGALDEVVLRDAALYIRDEEGYSAGDVYLNGTSLRITTYDYDIWTGIYTVDYENKCIRVDGDEVTRIYDYNLATDIGIDHGKELVIYYDIVNGNATVDYYVFEVAEEN